MKTIKKFEDFSFEDQLDQDLDDTGERSFISAVEDVCAELDNEHSSYSTMAESSRRGRGNVGNLNNPNHDFNDLLDGLKKLGWSVEKIKVILTKTAIQQLCDKNAVVDLLLYHFTNGKFPLSGMDQRDLDDNVGYGDCVIKYSYGYHKSQYGLLYLKQNFKTLDHYYKYLAQNMIPYLMSEELACGEISQAVSDGICHNENFKPNLFKSCYTFDSTSRDMVIDLQKWYHVIDKHDWFKYDTSYGSFLNTVRSDKALKKISSIIGIQNDHLVIEFDPVDFNRVENLKINNA